MPTDRELLVDAFARVRIALQHPDLTDVERSILMAECVNGLDEDGVRASLLLTQREYRRVRGEALDRACVMPKGKTKAQDD